MPFRHSIKSHIQIIQTLTLRRWRVASLSISAGQFLFFIHRYPGKTVVRRIAQNDQNPLFLLDLARRIILCHQFREIQRDLRHALFAFLIGGCQPVNALVR